MELIKYLIIDLSPHTGDTPSFKTEFRNRLIFYRAK